MHGDFSRLTFRPDRRYSAVLAQQGRVLLDAEANEQSALDRHHHRRALADLIGRWGGPRGATGFRITHIPQGEKDPADLHIGGGRYYVDGILVEADRPQPGRAVADEPGTDAVPLEWTYWEQPDAYRDREDEHERHHLPAAFPFLVYLKVTDLLVTAIQDPSLRETALGPSLPDTAARLKTAWQVLPLTAADGFRVPDRPTPENLVAAFDTWVRDTRSTATLAARAQRPARTEHDPCLTAPEARYRGEENQLYRVEVHQAGEKKTFKWSRENGSVTLPVSSVDGTWVTLAEPARDLKLGLSTGDWVDLTDNAVAARGETPHLAQVVDVDQEALRVELSAPPPAGLVHHPLLRRWDQRGPAQDLVEGRWLDLEDGIQVWFGTGGTYRVGDHWTIPARTLTGEVEWPVDPKGDPLLQTTHGIHHHCAPLAWVTAAGQLTDLRLAFGGLAQPL
ncbi:hypothetical protein JOF53_005904 [Crossiella equi]|uniref:Uncharacterized protein n=1 Tax=Crossiella equi TaxID=130796 RepID=A0ABS5AL93_9PSEU|nr:DUF6519 domain-containing protein [Crossiella equi]MBP2477032.1 hypothetical protein [Crossiella equi]